MPDLTGQSIGRYRIVEPLGEGGMATVYKGFDTRLDCDVAIKIIRRGQIGSDHIDKMLKRFEREAKRMAKFMHPNIVKVIDYGEFEGDPYLVMPYLPGGTLKELLKSRNGRPLSYVEAARILAPVARALEYAHEHDTIHRDVKPANILLTDKGVPVLADFGMAKILNLEDDNNLTNTGVGVGTPKYMAPEQWMNQISPQTDVYSLGVVFYELVTGRVPYDADTPAAVMLKQNMEPLPHPKQIVPDLPHEAERVIFNALAKDTRERFSDMRSFALGLERLAQKPIPHSFHPQAGDDKETLDYDGERGHQNQRGLPAASMAAEKTRPSFMNRDRIPVPPPYTPKPPSYMHKPSSSEQSVPTSQSGFRTSLMLSIIGIGLVVIVIIGASGWILNQWNMPGSMVNAEMPAVMESQTPTLPTKGELGVPVTQTPDVTNTPLVTLSPSAVPVRISAKDGMRQVYVPGGEFLMGSLESDGDADNNEKPVHRVYLDGYWIDKTEVTNGMYQKCVADDACQEPFEMKSSTRDDYYGNSQYTNYPVIYVNWDQAKEFCEWAGGRLPSEAEWEKAARGADGGKYPWGNGAPDSSLLNFNQNINDTTEVGIYSLGASPYGALDMAGNVCEWVNDWIDKQYYQYSPQKNPWGAASGESRGIRGGSWNYETKFIRAAYRDWDILAYYTDQNGFRCVRLP